MKLWMKSLAMLTVAGSLTLASCGEDDPLPPVFTNTAPTIGLELSSGNISDTLNITEQDALGAFVEVIVVTSDAENNIRDLSIERDGVAVTVASDDVRADSLRGILAANPLLILGDEKGGFRRSMFLRSPEAYNTATTYTITVTDSLLETATADVTITQPEEIVTTPLTATLTGRLLNQAGPTGTGGLDLDTGDGTGSMDAAAEIRDQGIDNGLPVDQNWIRKIAPVNGAVIRVPSPDFVSANPFADVNDKETIEAGFNSSSVDVPQSEEVQIGDVFIVSANGNFYMLSVTDVIETTSDNNDRYEFDIKF